MITSNQNPKIKLVRALLGRSKERVEAGAFVVEGVRLVEEAARAGWPIRFLLHSGELSSRGRALVESQTSTGVEVEEVSTSVLESVTDTESPQGLLAVVERKELSLPDAMDFVLILDQVRDPGNLGTLLRSAAAAGVQAVLLSADTVDAFAPKVMRAGMGAHFRLAIQKKSWEDIGKVCAWRNLQVYLADMGGEPCWDVDLRRPLALIVGGEAEGASEQAHEAANQRISVPMPGSTESLNAAAAGAVLMFEVVRQRRS